MNRIILDTLDEKFNAILREKSVNARNLTKAFAIGAAEGAMDVLTVVGAVTVVSLGAFAIISKATN